jgi:hypothetical protein
VLDEDFWPPLDWETIVGVDYGETNPTCFSFVAYTEDPENPGRVIAHCYDEVYEEDSSIEKIVTLVDEVLQFHARKRSEASGLKWPPSDRINVSRYSCDPAMRRHIPRVNENEPKKTVIDAFLDRSQERGFSIVLIPGNNTLDVGIDRLNWMFDNKLMTFSPRCVNVIEDIKNSLNDKNGKPKSGQKDHGGDATRYVGMELPGKFVFPKMEEKKTFIEKIKDRRDRAKKERFIDMGLCV